MDAVFWAVFVTSWRALETSCVHSFRDAESSLWPRPNLAWLSNAWGIMPFFLFFWSPLSSKENGPAWAWSFAWTSTCFGTAFVLGGLKMMGLTAIGLSPFSAKLQEQGYVHSIQ